ncbi:TlpA disulfide reductase family protein [Mucilaginibacter pedocola]|uniref:Thioredoxin domain-containing protein n=1 Tax=Mucilaginibacter pedocola TaxID=1792845 RepID=A0A1S9PEQ5_9SPHI|nr:TlpA disulfide reductase family protein [Mucilaginibacter pedocola]OOQ59441.1 hypothetical protein BC343_04465 [Mucilaginibacter pedocola]
MFKKVNIILPFLLIAPVIVFAQAYRISGKLTGFKNGSKVSLVNDETEATLNTTSLKQGAFVLAGNLNTGPMYLSVTVHEGEDDYTCEVFTGSGDISISADKKDFPYDVKITGPAEQLKFNAYQQALKPLRIKQDALMQAYLKAQNDKAAAHKAGVLFNKAGDEIRALEQKLIAQNNNTYFAANAYYEYAERLPVARVKQVYNGYPEAIKQSFYGKRILTFLTDGKPLQIGDKMYDFTAKDASGKKQKLSDYADKFILLDISSVYCGPCLESNDELRMLSKKYGKLLNVVTFSADKKAVWLKGIKDDKVTWASLNDGEGLNGRALLKYDGSALPSFFIISPEGKILDKWAGYERVKNGTGELETHLIKYIKKV